MSNIGAVRDFLNAYRLIEALDLGKSQAKGNRVAHDGVSEKRYASAIIIMPSGREQDSLSRLYLFYIS